MVRDAEFFADSDTLLDFKIAMLDIAHGRRSDDRHTRGSAIVRTISTSKPLRVQAQLRQRKGADYTRMGKNIGGRAAGHGELSRRIELQMGSKTLNFQPVRCLSESQFSLAGLYGKTLPSAPAPLAAVSLALSWRRLAKTMAGHAEEFRFCGGE